MEWATQGSVPSATVSGIYYCGLVDRVVFGQRLDLVILEVFYNLTDSMIL